MSAEEIAGSVETIETQAEKVLEEARAKASSILIKAKNEAEKILTSGMSLDEVKKERERMVKEAEAKADKEITEAKNKAEGIRNGAGKQVGQIVDRIVNTVTGVEVK